MTFVKSCAAEHRNARANEVKSAKPANELTKNSYGEEQLTASGMRSFKEVSFVRSHIPFLWGIDCALRLPVTRISNVRGYCDHSFVEPIRKAVFADWSTLEEAASEFLTLRQNGLIKASFSQSGNTI